MKTAIALTLALCAAAHAAGTADTQSRPATEQGYRIDEPGTITFTIGVKIKGKIEKPQVVIFLPKEKPYYRDIFISYSFARDVLEPLPFEPTDESGGPTQGR